MSSVDYLEVSSLSAYALSSSRKSITLSTHANRTHCLTSVRSHALCSANQQASSLNARTHDLKQGRHAEGRLRSNIGGGEMSLFYYSSSRPPRITDMVMSHQLRSVFLGPLWGCPVGHTLTLRRFWRNVLCQWFRSGPAISFSTIVQQEVGSSDLLCSKNQIQPAQSIFDMFWNSYYKKYLVPVENNTNLKFWNEKRKSNTVFENAVVAKKSFQSLELFAAFNFFCHFVRCVVNFNRIQNSWLH